MLVKSQLQNVEDAMKESSLLYVPETKSDEKKLSFC